MSSVHAHMILVMLLEKGAVQEHLLQTPCFLSPEIAVSCKQRQESVLARQASSPAARLSIVFLGSTVIPTSVRYTAMLARDRS